MTGVEHSAHIEVMALFVFLMAVRKRLVTRFLSFILFFSSGRRLGRFSVRKLKVIPTGVAPWASDMAIRERRLFSRPKGAR